MNFENIGKNFSILTSNTRGTRHLRDFILTQAVSGFFSDSKPESWTESTLGAEVKIIRGVTFPSSAKHREPADERIVCLRTTNVQDQVDWTDLLYIPETYVKNKDQYVRKNDILISMANSRELVGKVSLVTRDDIRCTLGGFIASIRCKETILPQFLMILLRAPETREKLIDSSTQTTNIANISLGRLQPLKIYLPTIEEQKDIVRKVEELFDHCDQLESSLLKAKDLNKAARKSSVDAIATAHTPEEFQIAWSRVQENWNAIVGDFDGLSDLRELILGIAFNGLLSESLSLTQAEWMPTTLGVLCDVRDGTHDSPKKATIGYPLVTSKNLKKGSVDLRDSYLISEQDYQDISKRSRVDKFDVLISMIGTVGEVAIERNEPTYAIKNVGLIKTGSELLARFIAYYLISPQAKSYIKTVSSGGVQKFLSLGKLRAMPINVPNSQIQEHLVVTLDQFMTICDALEIGTKEAVQLADRCTQSVFATVPRP